MYRLRNESDDTNPIDDSFTSDDQSIASSHSSLIRRDKNGCYRNFCNSGKIIPMIITLITLSIVTAFIVVFEIVPNPKHIFLSSFYIYKVCN